MLFVLLHGRSLDIHISTCAEKHGKDVPESFLPKQQQNSNNNSKTKRRSRGQSSSTEEKDDDDDDDVETSEGGLGSSWPNNSMRKKRLGMTHQQRK